MICQVCGRDIRPCNLNKHNLWHTTSGLINRKKCQHVNHEGLNCIYCGKECKNKNSLAQHEIRCSNNPERVQVSDAGLKAMQEKNRKFGNWNKGLTKETDARVLKNSITLHNSFLNGKTKVWNAGKHLSEAHKEAMRKSGVGGIRVGAGRGKKGWYKDIHCDSTWELAFVVYNLDHNIEVKRNKQAFDYIYENKTYRYYPDFIIEDCYIEIKNFWTAKVQAKIDCFPKNLKYKILYEKDLIDMINYCKQTYGDNYWELLYEK